MPQNENDSCYCDRSARRISQGDIIRELNITLSSRIGGARDFSLAPSFSYGIILSQDCDLEQHYQLIEKNATEVDTTKITHDKIIETLLVCPAFPVEKFLIGEHIEGKRMGDFESPKGRKKALDRITKNEMLSRYHFLPKAKDKFPDLVVDFKRFYTVPIEIFMADFNRYYITSIKDLHRERLSQRFTNYLGRIGLPGGE